jgi:transposase-like protein
VKKGKRYDEEFKTRSVSLVEERACKPGMVAKQLKITTETLQLWIDEKAEITVAEKEKIKQLEAENRKLRKKLADQKEISKIFKNATSIFIKP